MSDWCLLCPHFQPEPPTDPIWVFWGYCTHTTRDRFCLAERMQYKEAGRA